MKATLALLSVLAVTPACVSQQPAKTPPKEPFVVEAGEVLLTNLIDRCAAYLDFNILLSPQELAGQQNGPAVRLQKAIATDRAGCEEFLASMLHRSGLALTYVNEKGTILEVISMNGPRGREVLNRAVQRTPEEVLARPDLMLPVSTVLPLKHVNATIATNALRPFFASTGMAGTSSLTLGNVGNSTGLLLSGMQDQVAQAIRLVRACDVPPSPEQLERQVSTADRIEQLERRVKALEEKLGEAGKSK